MNADTISFQTVLDALTTTGRDFPRRYLQQFSDLGTLELKTLLDVWPRVAPSRKLSLLEGLLSLTEKDTLVNFDEFARAILNDPEASVRVQVIRLLAECEDTKLVPTYLNLLRNDPDLNVRVEAAGALGNFVALGELEEIPEHIHHQVEDALLAVENSDEDVRIRRAALEAVGFSSRPEAATLIASALHREDPAWQASAFTAMGHSADEAWEDEVTSALVHVNDRIRRAAVQAAGQLALKSARPILLKLLDDETDDDVIGAAIWSLSQIGGEDVRTYLENLLDQTDDEEQIEYIEEALDNLTFTENLDRFELFSFDPDLEDLDELAGDEEEEEK